MADAQPGDKFMFYCKRIDIAERHPILMNIFLLDAGHGDQIPCESKEEEDGFNEGEHGCLQVNASHLVDLSSRA